MSRLLCTLLIFTITSPSLAQTTVVDFESLPVPGDGFFNGDTTAGSPYRDNFTITGSRDNFGLPETLQLWESQGVNFFNGYTEAYLSFNGFAWSNVVDVSTPGFTNQYASYAGGGSNGAGGTNGGENYTVTFGQSSFFNLPDNVMLDSVDVTNTTYAGLAMLDGDGFTKKYGGASGNDEDYFKVMFTGYDATDLGGSSLGTVEFFLADYRFSDNSLDYILDTWGQVDLSSLASAKSIEVTFDSTDAGPDGINTPLYVAIDNVTFSVTSIPEPGSLGILIAVSITLIAKRKKRAKCTDSQPSCS